jgi:hypothetical protein
MLTPTFNQSYTVRLAVLLPEDVNNEAELAKSLQALYEGGSIAGHFHLELLGRFLVVTLERSIGDDAGCGSTLFDNLGMTWITVQDQLALEYEEALQNLPAGALGQTQQLGMLIMTTLRKHEAKVEGLRSQMVRINLSVTWLMPGNATAEDVKKKLVYHKDVVDLLSMSGAERTKAGFTVIMPGAEAPITYTLLDLVQ